MRKEYEWLYCEMLQDIKRCQHLPHPEKENAESCFWIARKYCDKLVDCIKERGFRNDNEEIDFFRNVKPQFTCQIEYFVLLSEALSFEPKRTDVPEEVKENITDEVWDKVVINSKKGYWEDEGKRCLRFFEKHSEFIVYYVSGEKDKDTEYFLRRNDIRKEGYKQALYDNDEEWLTYHEQIVRSCLAYQKYREYVNQKLAELAEK